MATFVVRVHQEQRTYCAETAKIVEKIFGDDDSFPRDFFSWLEYWQAAELAASTNKYVTNLEHAVNCHVVRCSSPHCFSLKRLLQHAKSCRHADCRECQFLNPVLMEHVRQCSNSRKCNVFACASITRTAFEIGYSNGRNAMLKEETFSMEPEPLGFVEPRGGVDKKKSKNAKKREKQKKKTEEDRICDQLVRELYNAFVQ